ncbi:hypothetical protein GVAV_003265 [Gurleya vavrai]
MVFCVKSRRKSTFPQKNNPLPEFFQKHHELPPVTDSIDEKAVKCTPKGDFTEIMPISNESGIADKIKFIKKNKNKNCKYKNCNKPLYTEASQILEGLESAKIIVKALLYSPTTNRDIGTINLKRFAKEKIVKKNMSKTCRLKVLDYEYLNPDCLEDTSKQDNKLN